MNGSREILRSGRETEFELAFEVEDRIKHLEQRLHEERIAFLALSPAARLSQLRRKLADRIETWKRETGAALELRPAIPRSEALERFIRRGLEIKSMELEGASYDEVAAAVEQNIAAVRAGLGFHS